MNKIIVFAKKKDGMSREDFIDKYENSHAAFGARYLGNIIKDHRRYYPLDLSHAPKDGENPVSVLPPYDVITIYSLRDESAFAEFINIWSDAAVQRAFREDELTLFDRDATLSGFCEVREGEGVVGVRPSTARKGDAV